MAERPETITIIEGEILDPATGRPISTCTIGGPKLDRNGAVAILALQSEILPSFSLRIVEEPDDEDIS